MSAPVDVLAVMQDAVDRLYLQHDSRIEAQARARDAVAELIAAVAPHVAVSFAAAADADAQGNPLIWCRNDVLNPCWRPGSPLTIPLRHWGVGDACPDCRLRAALARCKGGAE